MALFLCAVSHGKEKFMSVIEKAIRWMEAAAADNRHGYDQIYRWGEKGDNDCSAAVITAWQQAGVPVKTNGATYTGNMLSVFLKLGFKNVTGSINLSTGAGLKRGDVLLNTRYHTAMYCGNGREVEASINEKGTATGGVPGDQTGMEFLVRPYRNYPWNYVLRYDEKAKPALPVQKPGNPVNDYGLYYRAHCQTAGTLAPVRDGQTAGTTGYKKRLEGFWIDLRKLREKYPQAKLSAKVHIQGTGWVRYANVEHDTLLGTTGQGKRIEAVELTLTGVPGKNIYIQLHLAGHGWTGWIPGGFASGSTGIGTAVEAVRFKVA